ncbi:N-acetylmuramoyl-L-alanine amidase [Spongiactinospora sp. TRM90649]|uniref:N-acetylmuramoyl-L-alanine amidase n=1 Tax=Spongiactinospora sp. TRM90649 TaxID=3031114 RepID=UPI0023FA0B21|nr:N-acetylmuramoyl-L-alanine amidase [Spongiactinospora sp. TRM90649]MDF5757089.1 N-acetylmuramoyl-L-alanine amidase [Spongiactinospora sp. TRM90649]
MATMQEAFAEAARRYGVPESVLLAVSYMESRWDCNGGDPSTAAGFGPMHLTDGAARGRWRHHHLDDGEDPRGDGSYPPPYPAEPIGRHNDLPGSRHTLERAAELTGESVERLRADPAANIDGGAALLADYQRALGAPPSADPADWYGAVARYSSATNEEIAAKFADGVYEVIRAGATRVTDTGTEVTLPPSPEVYPSRSWLTGLGLSRLDGADAVECPDSIACEWIPALYRRVPEGTYGNYDFADRPTSQTIHYIVIHDTEELYDTTLGLVSNPAVKASWHYTLRSHDGHLAQHVRTRDVAWHAGNSYVNSKAIGLEHEGFLATGGTWYTEAMYRTSAELVRYLAGRFGIPLDRAHILGHDNVPALLPEKVQKMHEDPGPYWDWAHFFDLMGAPLHADGDSGTATVMILPDYDRNRPVYTGCDSDHPDATCPAHGSASVWLHTEPHEESPLVKDIGKHPTGDSTFSVYDHAARVSTGQRFVVAERRPDWTAIWYLGQKAWFHDPGSAPVAVPSRTRIATPRPGLESVSVYGRPCPEPAAYPADVEVQALTPLQYTFPAGQSYTVGLTTTGEYYKATTFDTTLHRVVRGTHEYHQIQFGHRVMFVKSEDVVVTQT